MHAVESGSASRGAARRFAVSPSAAIKLMQRVGATGSAAPAHYGGHRPPVLEPHEAELRRLVAATPDLTLAELQTALRQRVRAGLSTIHNSAWVTYQTSGSRCRPTANSAAPNAAFAKSSWPPGP